MKRCGLCRRWKPLEAFSRQRHGLQGRCRACHRDTSAARYRRERDAASWRAIPRQELIEQRREFRLTGGMVRCQLPRVVAATLTDTCGALLFSRELADHLAAVHGVHSAPADAFAPVEMPPPDSVQSER